jgi:altronate hydrolase
MGATQKNFLLGNFVTNQSRSNYLTLNTNDNVAVAIIDLPPGHPLETGNIVVKAAIPAGHKVATAKIFSGDAIIKYGQIIGFATSDIVAGDHVHSHNCSMKDFDRDYAFGMNIPNTKMVAPSDRLTFEGFRRPNGKIGTRNYIGVLTSVNCSASVARFIAESVEKSGILEEYPGIDGILPIVHGTGCGMASDGEGYDNLSRVLWGYAGHPNLAGALMVGLGCEVFQIPQFMDENGLTISDTFQVMTIQGSGGTRKTVERGVAMIKEMLPSVAASRRQTIDASEITLALQCGGSDGYSGISANPALGHAVDMLVAQGGTAILAETPEIYGAEHLLTRRAATREIGEKLIERIHWWEKYAKQMGGEIDNNPSPGNKTGGLTTILEKSLGATAKAGTTALNGVYLYGEQVTARGFVFMDSPGYDPASVTGQVASGANIVCFTTGRGSVFGYKPAPSIKLATNTQMYNRMSEDMDINCGTIVDGETSVEEMGQEILDYVISIASGAPTKSEALGFGGSEFVPWQIGAVM